MIPLSEYEVLHTRDGVVGEVVGFYVWKGLMTKVKSVLILQLHSITCFRGSVSKMA